MIEMNEWGPLMMTTTMKTMATMKKGEMLMKNSHMKMTEFGQMMTNWWLRTADAVGPFEFVAAVVATESLEKRLKKMKIKSDHHFWKLPVTLMMQTKTKSSSH
jgi:hypothetical protein